MLFLTIGLWVEVAVAGLVQEEKMDTSVRTRVQPKKAQRGNEKVIKLAKVRTQNTVYIYVVCVF